MRLVVGDLTPGGISIARSLYAKAGVEWGELTFASLRFEEVMALGPDRVDLIGEKALNAVAGKKGIDKWRGSVLRYCDVPLVATLDFNTLMSQQEMIPTVVSDLKKALSVPPEFYNLNPTVEDVAAFAGKSLCYDIETDYPRSDDITMIGLAHIPFHVTVVPWTPEFIPTLKRVLALAPNLIGQNILQFDGPRLNEVGAWFHSEVEEWDTMLMHHLIEPDSPHDLGFIQSKYSQKPYHKDQKDIHEALYCARDVDATLQAFHALKPLLVEHKLLDLYRYTQVPLAKICHLMTKTGIRQDPSRVAMVREDTLAEITEWEAKLPEELKPRVEQRFHKKTGKLLKPKDFVPWRSDSCVKNYLYQTLRLKERKSAKSGRACSDKKALAALFRLTNNPAIDALRHLRGLSTLLTGFLKVAKGTETLVHPRFNVHGTNSGRLSSAGPNFQNQPPAARMLYVPAEKDWCFVEADFSQGENRLVAWYSGDKKRMERLAQPGFSEHKWNAATFFDMKYEDVKKDNSRDQPYGQAKILTHGMSYGMGPRKIAQDNELEEKYVRNLIERWRENNPLTVMWQRATAKLATEAGVLVSAFGRRRWFWSDRTYTESLAYLPQSTLADVSYRSLISLLYRRIGWSEAKAMKVCSVLAPLPEEVAVHLQVHDSILISCPVQIMNNALECLKIAMEQPHPELNGYSIPVEIKVGTPNQSWGELE